MKLRDILFIPAIAVVLALEMGSSCASTGNSGGNSGSNSSGNLRGDYDNSSPNYDRPNRIPRNSDLVRDGDGKLKWTADLDGDVYVYDPAKDHIDYTGPVRRGQEVVVNPKDDKVTVGDRVVSTQDLRKDNAHQIYFARHRETRNDHGTPRWEGHPAVVREGKGEISSRASSNGNVTIMDASDDRVVTTFKIRNNAIVVVTPDKDRVSVDGKSVFDGNLVRDHAHQILFDRD